MAKITNPEIKDKVYIDGKWIDDYFLTEIKNQELKDLRTELDQEKEDITLINEKINDMDTSLTGYIDERIDEVDLRLTTDISEISVKLNETSDTLEQTNLNLWGTLVEGEVVEGEIFELKKADSLLEFALQSEATEIRTLLGEIPVGATVRTYIDESIQLRTFINLPSVETLDELIFPEDTTRNYLCKVLENHSIYMWLTPNGAEENDLNGWVLYDGSKEFVDEQDLENAITNHNISSNAHNDIRNKIEFVEDNYITKELKTGSTSSYKVLSDNNYSDEDIDKVSRLEDLAYKTLIADDDISDTASISRTKLASDVIVSLDKADVAIPIAEKAEPFGTATLDENGKVPLSQMSDVMLGQLVNGGTFNAQSARVSLTLAAQTTLGIEADAITLSSGMEELTGYLAHQNIFYITSTSGNFAGCDFQVGDWLVATLSGWGKVDNSDAVTGVKGANESTYRIGQINLTPENIGAASAAQGALAETALQYIEPLTILRNNTIVGMYDGEIAKSINISVPTGSLSNKDQITNSDISETASISESKLNLSDNLSSLSEVSNNGVIKKVDTGLIGAQIINEDISPTAGIEQSKLNLVDNLASLNNNIATSGFLKKTSKNTIAASNLLEADIPTLSQSKINLIGSLDSLSKNESASGVLKKSSEDTISADLVKTNDISDAAITYDKLSSDVKVKLESSGGSGVIIEGESSKFTVVGVAQEDIKAGDAIRWEEGWPSLVPYDMSSVSNYNLLAPNGKLVLFYNINYSPYLHANDISGPTSISIPTSGLFTSKVQKIIFSPDSTKAVAFTSSTAYTLLDLTTVPFTKIGTGTILGNYNYAHFTPDSTKFITTHTTTPFIYIQDATVFPFTNVAPPSPLPSGQPSKFTYSNNGKFMIASWGSSLNNSLTYDTSAVPFSKIVSFETTIAGVEFAFSKDDTRLLVHNANQQLISHFSLFDTTQSPFRLMYTTPTTYQKAQLSSDGKKLCIMSTQYGIPDILRLYDITGDEMVEEWALPQSYYGDDNRALIKSVLFSPDNTKLNVLLFSNNFIQLLVFDMLNSYSTLMTSKIATEDNQIYNSKISPDGTILWILIGSYHSKHLLYDTRHIPYKEIRLTYWPYIDYNFVSVMFHTHNKSVFFTTSGNPAGGFNHIRKLVEGANFVYKTSNSVEGLITNSFKKIYYGSSISDVKVGEQGEFKINFLTNPASLIEPTISSSSYSYIIDLPGIKDFSEIHNVPINIYGPIDPSGYNGLESIQTLNGLEASVEDDPSLGYSTLMYDMHSNKFRYLQKGSVIEATFNQMDPSMRTEFINRMQSGSGMDPMLIDIIHNSGLHDGNNQNSLNEFFNSVDVYNLSELVSNYFWQLKDFIDNGYLDRMRNFLDSNPEW